MARILVVDNYDSFVWNIVSYLAQIVAEVEVWRNDDARFDAADWSDGFDGVLLSPGPGTPEAAGVCIDVVRTHGGRVPIFGVCLGLQSIGVASRRIPSVSASRADAVLRASICATTRCRPDVSNPRSSSAAAASRAKP